MNVNNNNVIQILRSNYRAKTRQEAIALLDGFHNHQYGQFIVVKYGDEVTTTDADGNQNISQPLMVACGVSYPDQYTIVFDGDLATCVTSVTLGEKADKAGMIIDPETNDVVVDVKWNWNYDEDERILTIEDALDLTHIHRLPKTPVDNRDGDDRIITDPSTPTKFSYEVWNNDWWNSASGNRYSDKFLILGKVDGEGQVGWMSIADFIVDKLNVDGGKWWWQDNVYKTGSGKLKPVAHPEIVAPSLNSVGAMKDEIDVDLKELSKRVNDVHHALHDYAEWDKQGHELDVFLNDGGPLKKVVPPKGEVVPVDIPEETAEKIENKMCLFIWSPEYDKYFIDDDGILWRETEPRPDWECPTKPESETLAHDPVWDKRFE